MDFYCTDRRCFSKVKKNVRLKSYRHLRGTRLYQCQSMLHRQVQRQYSYEVFILPDSYVYSIFPLTIIVIAYIAIPIKMSAEKMIVTKQAETALLAIVASVCTVSSLVC
jgi:uncharacterized membrane protein